MDFTKFQTKSYWRRFWKEQKSFLGVLALLIIGRSVVIDQYQIPSESMVPNLLIGDRIFVNKMAYDLKFPLTQQSLYKIAEPDRGDIIVFISPKEPDILLVKRLVGLPGDKFKIQRGFIWVNDQPIPGTEQALETAQRNSQFSYTEKMGDHEFTVRRELLFDKPDLQEFIIPEGSYFFMGDNRDNSLDSRYWGFATRDQFKGKAFRIFFSLNMIDGFPWINFSRWGAKLP